MEIPVASDFSVGLVPQEHRNKESDNRSTVSFPVSFTFKDDPSNLLYFTIKTKFIQDIILKLTEFDIYDILRVD